MDHPHTPSEIPASASPAFAEALAKGYEPHDLGLRAVFVFIAGLVITLVVVLAVIYAIMMALAEHDRSGDPIGSPVMVKIAPVYAPLQPSPEHDVLDQTDMETMINKTQEAINSEGVTETGRHHMGIEDAINKVQPLLVVKLAEAAH